MRTKAEQIKRDIYFTGYIAGAITGGLLGIVYGLICAAFST